MKPSRPVLCPDFVLANLTDRSICLIPHGGHEDPRGDILGLERLEDRHSAYGGRRNAIIRDFVEVEESCRLLDATGKPC